MKQSTSLAALTAVGLGAVSCRSDGDRSWEEQFQLNATVNWPVTEREDTPKICMSGGSTEQQARRIKQLGVNYAQQSPGRIPWTEAQILKLKDELAEAGLRLCNMYMFGFDNVILGREGAETDIENVKQSIRAAGAAGIPVVEYNWYVHRLMEGYYPIEGRGGSGYTGYDYDRAKDLPPEPDVGIHTAEELWERYTYFLEEVIPVAEESNVRMAVHPNDPPAPVSRGSDEIVASFDDWKRLVNIVDSPANGMTVHPGYYKELGLDDVEVIRFMGEHDRINHVHFRNVQLETPQDAYAEVFPDNGNTDMFASMRELIRQGYTRAIYPEHPRALDYDREHPDGLTSYEEVGGGGYAGMVYNIAYTRAMLQAALITEGKV